MEKSNRFVWCCFRSVILKKTCARSQPSTVSLSCVEVSRARQRTWRGRVSQNEKRDGSCRDCRASLSFNWMHFVLRCHRSWRRDFRMSDAVKMFGLETIVVRSTTRLAGLCSSRVGIPELSQDLRDFLTRVQIVVERVPRPLHLLRI